MYVLLRMPFKVYSIPCFIIFLPECTHVDRQREGSVALKDVLHS